MLEIISLVSYMRRDPCKHEDRDKNGKPAGRASLHVPNRG
jgi:hypothetical protein